MVGGAAHALLLGREVQAPGRLSLQREAWKARVIDALLIILLAGACLGDSNGNAVIDGGDFNAYHQAYGSSYTEAGYNPLVDYTADGQVDGADFQVLELAYGQRCRAIKAGDGPGPRKVYCGRPAVVTWAPGASLPLWPAGRCVRVPRARGFAPTISCDPARVWELEEKPGACGGSGGAGPRYAARLRHIAASPIKPVPRSIHSEGSGTTVMAAPTCRSK